MHESKLEDFLGDQCEVITKTVLKHQLFHFLISSSIVIYFMSPNSDKSLKGDRYQVYLTPLKDLSVF